ncbi:hypothetical protein [Pseudonocardia spinosispora]|uniref:hypothetical protein n=1 Tax=Pseudonocardia spinosispora TaxID=103441 RepID=UPI0003FA1D67|nr:hypothetical protein [Pseudonocardia spinosispora]
MPAKPTQPEPTEPEAENIDAVTAEEEVPLNRAARRAKLKQKAPTHVGPQPGRTNEQRFTRGSSKRPS